MPRLLSTLAAILLVVACQSEPRTQAASQEEIESRIAAIENNILPTLVISGEEPETATLAERMEHHNVPGISIAVINNGEIEWAKGYGMADVEEGRPVTTTTLFQAASISKPVAATAALTFVQEDRITLDDNVNDWLTSWKVPDNEHTAVQPVTLRELVTHSAGMTVHGFPGYARSDDVPNTIGVLDGEGNTDPIRVDIEPGTQWRYSGGGYTVMQQLLMDVDGKPFAQILQERVLQPAGMTESTYEQPLPDSRWSQAATAYRSDGTMVEEKWHVYPEQAAAGLWTTPSDLARFAIMLQQAYAGQSEAVLTKQMATQMLTPDDNDWGLGPAIQGDGARFGHGGSNEGYRCTFTAFIEGGKGVAIMTNSDSGGGLMSEVVLTVFQEYGWPGVEPTVRDVADIEPAAYEAIAGRYSFPEFGVITISYVDGRLWADVPGQATVELLPESETEFFTRDDQTEVKFIREDGRIVAFEVQGIRGEKIE